MSRARPPPASKGTGARSSCKKDEHYRPHQIVPERPCRRSAIPDETVAFLAPTGPANNVEQVGRLETSACRLNLEDGRGKGERGGSGEGIAITIGMVRIDGLMQKEEWMRQSRCFFPNGRDGDGSAEPGGRPDGRSGRLGNDRPGGSGFRGRWGAPAAGGARGTGRATPGRFLRGSRWFSLGRGRRGGTAVPRTGFRRGRSAPVGIIAFLRLDVPGIAIVSGVEPRPPVDDRTRAQQLPARVSAGGTELGVGAVHRMEGIELLLTFVAKVAVGRHGSVACPARTSAGTAPFRNGKNGSPGN